MKRIFPALIVAVAFAAAALFPAAQAATPNYPSGVDVLTIPFHFSGAVSATQAGAAKFNMPMRCKMIGVGASSRAIVGATNTIDVKMGGTTILSSVITIAAAGTYYEGTIATSAITDEGVITVDINIVGTSLTDTTVLLTCARK